MIFDFVEKITIFARFHQNKANKHPRKSKVESRKSKVESRKSKVDFLQFMVKVGEKGSDLERNGCSSKIDICLLFFVKSETEKQRYFLYTKIGYVYDF